MFSFARWQNCCAVRLKICNFADSDSTVFIAHQRDTDIANLSVRPSVWPTNPLVPRGFLGAHSAKVELCARASIRLACFAGTCQILVAYVMLCYVMFGYD